MGPVVEDNSMRFYDLKDTEWTGWLANLRHFINVLRSFLIFKTIFFWIQGSRILVGCHVYLNPLVCLDSLVFMGIQSISRNVGFFQIFVFVNLAISVDLYRLSEILTEFKMLLGLPILENFQAATINKNLLLSAILL